MQTEQEMYAALRDDVARLRWAIEHGIFDLGTDESREEFLTRLSEVESREDFDALRAEVVETDRVNSPEHADE